MYSTIETANVTNSIFKKTKGSSSVRNTLKEKHDNLIRIQRIANASPILTETFILAVHRDEEFLV